MQTIDSIVKKKLCFTLNLHLIVIIKCIHFNGQSIGFVKCNIELVENHLPYPTQAFKMDINSHSHSILVHFPFP